jgi:hypothetical protein
MEDQVKETSDLTNDSKEALSPLEVTSLIEDSNSHATQASPLELKSSDESKNEKTEKIIEFKLDNLNLSKANVLNILEDLRVIKKRFNHIENILKESERAQYGPSRDLPGENGIYDGEFMVTAGGIKYEVPKNYAAKSLLINGDELKRMEQDGKVAYKIVNKVSRKKIEGLLSKKDGKYVILSDSGTFNLLKTAVEFRNIKQGEWVLAVIPETGSANNFAAIDKVIKKETKKEVKFYDKPKTEPLKTPSTPKPAPKPENHRPVVSVSTPTPAPKQPEASKPEAPKTSPMPKIQFSDDDLV